MNVRDRQNYIIEKARDEGYVIKTDLARELDTSVETIRRDIKELCEKNLLVRTKGGAVPAKNNVRRDAPYINRVHQFKSERMSIGIAAASLIKDGDIVAFDSGTSIQAVAAAVNGVNNVTLITDSLPSALILYNKIELGEISGRVIVIGGELHSDRCTAGSMADELVDTFHFDIAFISCSALSLVGVSSNNLNICCFSKHLLANTSIAVLIAESDKLGKNSLHDFARLEDFNKVIVDDKHSVPPEIKKALIDASVELVIAKDVKSK